VRLFDQTEQGRKKSDTYYFLWGKITGSTKKRGTDFAFDEDHGTETKRGRGTGYCERTFLRQDPGNKTGRNEKIEDDQKTRQTLE